MSEESGCQSIIQICIYTDFLMKSNMRPFMQIYRWMQTQQIYYLQSPLYNCNMKNQLDDNNYEGIIGRLTKGTADEKANSLKKLIFLYENARSRIYLYERRITESLQLLLLMQQKDIATHTLNLLQKIIINTTAQSDIFSIIKKRLFSKIVLNLGSVDITTRRVSHKCILEYVRKFRDYESVIPCYIKTGIQQTQNIHLKLKAISSLHSLVNQQSKSFMHGAIHVQILVEELIYAAYQKQNVQIRKVAILCLIIILKIVNAQKTLKMICSTSFKQLNELKAENNQLAKLIDHLLKNNFDKDPKDVEPENQSAPSPKFMSITEQQLKKQIGQIPNDMCLEIERVEKGVTQNQLKLLNDVSFAEQFLKKLQKNGNWELNQIKQFAPHLQKYLIDQSIKLFSISKKIVQVIFDSNGEEQREYYVILVPCVVNGIGNKRFIVRKNLDKLVRQYIKNHTQVWIHSFIQRITTTNNTKIKEILIQLFLHAYRTSPEFYYPYQRTFNVLENQIKDSYSNIKWKAIDCIITVLEKGSENEKVKQEMMNTLSPQVYHKVLRKMNKTHNSIGSNESLEPNSPAHRKKKIQKRLFRLTTDEPSAISHEERQIYKKNNISEEKNQSASLPREKKARKSQADIEFNRKKFKGIRQKIAIETPKGEPTSITKLPQLKRNNLPSITSHPSKIQFPIFSQSPVKKSMGEKNIMYVDKENLPQVSDPKNQLEKALVMIKDNSWNAQFESINSLRSVIQHHKQLINDELFSIIINELLNCLNNLRSGVSKITLICLGELIAKFKKKSYPFTEQIISTLLKKSLTTSDFIQQQIRKCIWVSAEELCPIRMVSTLNNLKQSAKGSEFKISILGMIDAICQRNQKVYKKQVSWIWNSLIEFHEDHNLSVKNEVRKVAKGIIDLHKNWKQEISGLRLAQLEKIDKIIKNIIQSGSQEKPQNWLQEENKELSKLIQAKAITPKFFVAQLQKLEDLDKQYLSKKNIKDRSRILNNNFTLAIQYPNQFVQCPQWRKYFQISLEHIDEKNPGLLLNSLNILNKCLENEILVEAIGQDQQLIQNILEKTIIAGETKRIEMGQVINIFIQNFYNKIGASKCCKELLKMFYSLFNNNHSNLPGYYGEIILNSVLDIIKDNSHEESPNKNQDRYEDYHEDSQEKYQYLNSARKSSRFDCIETSITKIINKQISDQYRLKLRELLIVCSITLNPNVYQRILLNPRAKQILQNSNNTNRMTLDTKNHLSGQKRIPNNNKSQPKERPSLQRNKMMSGDKKFRKRQFDRGNDLSKENQRSIRGSHH